MNVLVERYQRRKYVNQPNSQMLYYVRQKSGTVRVMDINKLADAIEANSSLTAGDVKHSIEAFVEQLRLSLTQGDKVKIDGLGTFHITLTSDVLSGSLEYDLLWVNQGYGTAIPSGWLIALPYLRNNAHVRLIVPSKMGHTTAQQYVNPYFYDIWKFEKAKS